MLPKNRIPTHLGDVLSHSSVIWEASRPQSEDLTLLNGAPV